MQFKLRFGRTVWCIAGGLGLLLTAAAFSGRADDDPPPRNDNPYLAPDDLSAEELARFLERMLSKPDTIRARPGFADAVVDATERLLALGGDDKLQASAILARFEALHFVACKGDDQADGKLMALAEQFQNDPRPDVAAAAQFHLLEKQSGQADAMTPDDRAKLLDELKEFFSDRELTRRHLRLASNTVHVINLLEDKEAANAAFVEFGGLFAK